MCRRETALDRKVSHVRQDISIVSNTFFLGVFFLLQWTGEGTHSIVQGRVLNCNPIAVREGDSVTVKVQEGKKSQYYKASVIASGRSMRVLLDATYFCNVM